MYGETKAEKKIDQRNKKNQCQSGDKKFLSLLSIL